MTEDVETAESGSGSAPRVRLPNEARAELLREAVTMTLYVSVVLIAELAAIPEKHFADGRVTGAVGGQLLAVVWGTAVGLAVAHWFAFGLAAPALRGARPTRFDTHIGLAQIGSAMFVAAVSSVPVLLFSDVHAQETTGDVPAFGHRHRQLPARPHDRAIARDSRVLRSDRLDAGCARGLGQDASRCPLTALPRMRCGALRRL